MPQTSEHKCTRCGVTVEADKLAVPNRCTDPQCPLNAIAKERRRAAITDFSNILNAG